MNDYMTFVEVLRAQNSIDVSLAVSIAQELYPHLKDKYIKRLRPPNGLLESQETRARCANPDCLMIQANLKIAREKLEESLRTMKETEQRFIQLYQFSSAMRMALFWITIEYDFMLEKRGNYDEDSTLSEEIDHLWDAVRRMEKYARFPLAAHRLPAVPLSLRGVRTPQSEDDNYWPPEYSVYEETEFDSVDSGPPSPRRRVRVVVNAPCGF